MKGREQIAFNDGFDRNVAEKMPKIKRQEGFPSFDREPEAPRVDEEPIGPPVPEKQPEKKAFLSASKSAPQQEKQVDVLNLIEDLHSQLLVSHRTKRALETDLSFSQKTIQQLVLDNNELGSQLEDLRSELKKLKELQKETTYLKEEHLDAIEKIKQFQLEARTAHEALARTTHERDDALNRLTEHQSQFQEVEVLRIKGKLREKEASHFIEENKELRSRLEELQLQNMELEREYDEMRKSFSEVKESLTLLRDSCRANYYNLSDNPD